MPDIYIEVRSAWPVYCNGMVHIPLEGCDRSIDLETAEVLLYERGQLDMNRLSQGALLRVLYPSAFFD